MNLIRACFLFTGRSDADLLDDRPRGGRPAGDSAGGDMKKSSKKKSKKKDKGGDMGGDADKK